MAGESAPATRAEVARDSIDRQLSYSNAPASPSSPAPADPFSSALAAQSPAPVHLEVGYDNLDSPDSQRRQLRPTNESYTPIQENPLTPVLREPLSTFSIDVDTASYANTRRFLNRSSLPPRDAVRIGIQGKKVGLEQRNSNFVFLIDVSGSMDQPDKLPLVKESLRLLVEQLDEKDRVSIVTYAGSSGLVLPPTNGDQKDRIRAAIANMTPGGSTHGSAGIQLAYEQAIAGFIPEGVNRVILCSDGDFNVGISSPSDLEKLITEKARSGVFLSVLGFGTGNLKDRTMETLADKGNGNYGYIDSLSEARKLLVEQMTGTLITIAKDVKIQVEFNPAQVASYRLIGYENRLLAKEDFNDDTKDAGEIGAGHSVTALYEIVPVGVTPATAPVDSLKYQTPPAAPAASPATPKSPELLTVKLRYKAPEGATSQLIEVPVTDKETTLVAATPEFKFTTAVAAYGLMLRQSTYRGPLTWDQIRQLALEGKGTDPHGYRAEFLQLLDKARSLLPSNQ
jgi:secreted protein with Ig-like and vWFA domain